LAGLQFAISRPCKTAKSWRSLPFNAELLGCHGAACSRLSQTGLTAETATEVAGDHFTTVESISKRAVAIHNAGGFGTAAKNQSLAGRITGKSSVWSGMARMFFQPIAAPRFGLLPEPDDNRGLDPNTIGPTWITSRSSRLHGSSRASR
jgi:hypothetical protein